MRNQYFERFIMLIICANCVTLAMDTGRPGREVTNEARVLGFFEVLWTAIFGFEMVVKITAMGFVTQQGSYLRDGWNVLDFVVVVLGFVGLAPAVGNYTAARTIRVFRPLRTITTVPGMRDLVLTLLKSIPMLMDVVVLCTFAFFIFGIIGVQLFAGQLAYRCAAPDFSAAGLQIDSVTGEVGNITYTWIDEERCCSGPYAQEVKWYWTGTTFERSGGVKGLGHHCPTKPSPDAPFGQVCQLYGNPNGGYTSFDNILWAWLTIFQTITMEGWTDNMYFTMDAVNQWVWLYYVAVVILGAFFAVNLALAVLYLHFAKTNMEKQADVQLQENLYGEGDDKDDGDSFEGEDEWGEEFDEDEDDEDDQDGNDDRDPNTVSKITARQITLRRLETQKSAAEQEEPEAAATAPERFHQRIRRFISGPFTMGPDDKPGIVKKICKKVDDSEYFKKLSTLLIIFNTIVMAMVWYGMPESITTTTNNINYAMTFYFSTEMLIMLCSRGFSGYASDSMNLFDSFVVFGSLIELGIAFSSSGTSGGSVLSILRAFRLLRIFKLARSWKELNKILNTLATSVTKVGYLSLIMILFIFVCGLLGMQFFGYKFAFCDEVGGQQICPPGLAPGAGCPAHFDCYVPCQPSQVHTWFEWPQSRYNGMAYCERFPRTPPGTTNTSIQYEFWAQVGKSNVQRPNYDSIFNAFIAIFDVFTDENWNTQLYWGIQATGNAPMTAIFFVIVIIMGQYIILNLFLAILLEQFAADDPADTGGAKGEDASVNKGGDHKIHAISGDSATVRHTIMEGPEAARDLLGHPALMNGFMNQENTMMVEARPTALHTKQGTQNDELLGHPHGLSMRLASRMYLMGEPAVPAETTKQHKEDDTPALYGTSLFIFTATNPMRKQLARLVVHKNFESFILALIFISSLALALDTPGLSETSTLKKVLNEVDVILTFLFTLEALFKIVAYGLLFNGSDSYLRSGWNILDFIIVVVGLVMVQEEFQSGEGQSQQLKSLRALRTLRALRPLRMISRAEGMKVVINTLFQSIPSLGNVVLVCLLFFLIFGIMAVNLFGGGLWSCQSLDGEVLDPYYFVAPGQTITKQWCRQQTHTITTSQYHSKIMNASGGIGVALPPYQLEHKWRNRPRNFDNIFTAMLTLFQISTFELWLDAMYQAVDSNGLDKQPTRDANPFISIFFICFLVFISFFVLNLFVGVTIDKFNEIQEKHGSGLLLTPQQEQWVRIQKLLADTNVATRFVEPEGSWRKRIFRLVMSDTFDTFIIAMIICNIVIMAMVHRNMSPTWQTAQTFANLAFTIIFNVEAVVKILGLGPVPYFKNSWNAFDFSVAILSTVSVAFDLLNVSGQAYMPIIRVLRVARIFRLIPKAKGLNLLLQTFLYSLPALVNVGSVLMLFYFIFACMGMNLFGKIKPGEYLNDWANFHNVPNTLLLLFRMCTGENWDGIMYDTMVNTDCLLVTSNATLLDLKVEGSIKTVTLLEGEWLSPGPFANAIMLRDSLLLDNQCTPHPMASIIYFITFIVVCAFILLNLVIAVILDNIQNSNTNDEMPVSPGSIAQFVEVWSELDPLATNYIDAKDLPTLIAELNAPLGAKGDDNVRSRIQSIIMSIDIPNRGNRVHFLETLHALSGRVAGTELPEQEEMELHAQFTNRLPPNDLEDPPKYTAAHFYAAMYVQAAIRGFLKRHQMYNKMAEEDASMHGTDNKI